MKLSMLEQAVDALLNKQQDKAEELFHRFIVEKARVLHERNRLGEDFDLDENWGDEVKSDTYFTTEDLDSLEGTDDSEIGDEDMDAGVDGAEELDVDGDVVDADDGEGEGDLDGAADDVAGDLDVDGAEGGEGSVEDRLDDIEAAIADFAAEFTAAMDALVDGDDAEAGEDADLGADEATDDLGDFGGEDDFGGDVDADAGEDDELPTDDMEDEAPMESEEFDDMMESIIDELDKVSVELTDGKEIGTGSSFTQNKGAVIPQKNPTARQGGQPIKQKRDDHKGFERETAPASQELPKKRNNKNTGTAGQKPVSKEGDKSAELNKLGSEENTKSLF